MNLEEVELEELYTYLGFYNLVAAEGDPGLLPAGDARDAISSLSPKKTLEEKGFLFEDIENKNPSNIIVGLA